MKTNITKAITIHSAYGVEVEYTDGEIFTVDSKIERYNEPLKKVSVFRAIHDIEQGKAKLLLHSLDKLTQEIDGKVGIVELAKIAFKEKPNWYLRDGQAFCSNYPQLSFYFKDGDFYADDGDMMRTVHHQLELFNYLLEKGYNVFGLSSEYFKEKSI